MGRDRESRGSQRDSRRGSSATDKQIYAAVKDEKIVTFVLANGHRITGFVMSVDDFHWVVYEPRHSRVTSVHKTCPYFFVPDQAETISDFPAEAEEIRKRTAAFQDYVLKNHYHHSQDLQSVG